LTTRIPRDPANPPFAPNKEGAMPTSTPSQAPEAEGAIRAVVERLGRPDGDGGLVVERAAIIAEGEPALAIESWILAHGGEPELPLLRAPRVGLHGRATDFAPGGLVGRPPRRYVLPATVFSR
jgi:hypothetical protein